MGAKIKIDRERLANLVEQIAFVIHGTDTSKGPFAKELGYDRSQPLRSGGSWDELTEAVLVEQVNALLREILPKVLTRRFQVTAVNLERPLSEKDDLSDHNYSERLYEK